MLFAPPDQVTTLSTAIDEAIAGRPVTSAELQNTTLAVCTAALSSFEFVKN